MQTPRTRLAAVLAALAVVMLLVGVAVWAASGTVSLDERADDTVRAVENVERARRGDPLLPTTDRSRDAAWLVGGVAGCVVLLGGAAIVARRRA